MLAGSGLQIRDLNQDVVRQVGLLKCQYRNVSMGDCIVASTAIINRAKVLSDDLYFDIINGVMRSWV